MPSKCVKVGYATEFLARQRALWLMIMKPWKHPRPLRTYACFACKQWHLSSKHE